MEMEDDTFKLKMKMLEGHNKAIREIANKVLISVGFDFQINRDGSHED